MWKLGWSDGEEFEGCWVQPCGVEGLIVQERAVQVESVRFVVFTMNDKMLGKQVLQDLDGCKVEVAMLGAVLLVKGPCLLKEVLEFVLKVLSRKAMMSGPF